MVAGANHPDGFAGTRSCLGPSKSSSSIANQRDFPFPTNIHQHLTSATRQLNQLHKACDLRAILAQVKERLVLAYVAFVEVRLPPGLAQKNTGSRYAPNTLSSAARIS